MAVATVIAVAAVGLLLLAPEDPVRSLPAPTTAAPRTRAAAPAAPSTPKAPAQRPVLVAAPTRVEVPSVDLAVDVVPVTPAGDALDPPTLTEAYWIQTYGTPGTDADNTVYLAGHSFDRGQAAFNPLFDKDAQVPVVQPGAEIVVTTAAGRLTYAVESTQRYPKGGLPDVDEVWRIVPGRLVLITCFQRNDGGASRDNLVVYAHLVGSAPTAGATASAP